jgi:hypothetical protein
MGHKGSLLDAASNLAWSHWTALGVAGVVSPPSTAVDPEALILMTVALGDADPRLLDEATDWCVRYSKRFVSLSRLRNLRVDLDDVIGEALDELAATVNQHAGTKWPTAARPRRYVPSGKSKLDRLDHLSHALLRMRCAFGISARAEILHMLLTAHSQNHWIGAAAFTELGYSKRNIAVILDDLVLAGILSVRRLGNTNGYKLVQSAHLKRLLDPVPGRSPRWHLRMPLIAHFISLDRRITGKEPLVRSVEAKRLVDQLGPVLARLDLVPPAPGDPQSYADAVSTWVVDRLIEAG